MGADQHTQELFLYHELKQGKEYAFDFFFNYYYPGLCVYAQHLISIQESDARNLVQDVFLKFWDDRDRLNVQSSVRSYLFASVKNKCLDYLKKKHRQPAINDLIPESNVVDHSFDTFVLDELEELLRQSLAKLPERCREIFELSRFEGLKNREIAERLMISEKTVENQMTKALRFLKIELKDYLPLFLLFDTFDFFK